ncbi:hypothetical protein OUZ56_013800 [Daphnia magna]|uniref:HAT C-terminal dimerisation domain-containing protein n=1 Tax=Daphnia magna TaxID=35525 RepID=A0ABQ9Z6Z4_9CRUS|nr:hypothetical protein OUZ56_013800 [Daphnia magna]
MDESYSGVFVHPSFFKYHGPAGKAGNYLFICENCPSKKKPDGTLWTYSCNQKSRQNLFSHMKSEDEIPSSAAVERLFSLGGRVLTPTRTLLSDTHFEIIVFLKSNYSFLSSL